MQTKRFPSIMLVLFVFSIVAVVLFMPPSIRKDVNEGTPPVPIEVKPTEQQSGTADASNILYLSEEEQELFRNATPGDRAALLALNYARAWHRGASQDSTVSEKERASAAANLQRFEKIVEEIKKRHLTTK